MLILGIETSCDDTSLALYSVRDGVLDMVTASQVIHDDYGGVVPEIASRQHMQAMLPVYHELIRRNDITVKDIGGIGVTHGPGLVGSLLVGVGFAKALAYATGIPAVGVHHIEAHVLSNELEGESLQYPCVVLIVSGGHSQLFHCAAPRQYELVGNTRDDAAGEAFDKIAKLLGLGYPGGPALQALASSGDPKAFDFPRAMKTRNIDFSFSGLKTAVRLCIEKYAEIDDTVRANVAASAQEAIVDVLTDKTIRCARSHTVKHVYLAGGVAANGPLRERLQSACAANGMTYHAPLLKYCMDNGAMIARTALVDLSAGIDDARTLNVFARGILRTR